MTKNKLPEKFSKNGFVFTCLERSGQVALYSRKATTFDYEDFEIIRVRHHLTGEDNKEVTEVYPSPKVWGTFATTKVNELEAKEEFKDWAAKFKGIAVEQFDPLAEEAAHKRGRKPLDIKLEFPETEWTVQEMANKYEVSTGYINTHLKPLLESGEVEKIGTKKVTKGRGKPTNFFKFNPNKALIKTAKKSVKVVDNQ